VPGRGAVLDTGGPLADHEHRFPEAGRARIGGVVVWLASGAS
jgi:hypothetical protein